MVDSVVDTTSFFTSRRAFLTGSAAFVAGLTAGPAFANSVGGFVASVRADAVRRGVPGRIVDQALAGFAPLDSVIDLTKKQPEFVSTPADYVAKRVTDTRISTGRAKAGEWSNTLQTVESLYGVQAEILLSIWGIETNFGGYMGKTNTIHALATLSWAGYRESFFRKELLTALEVLAAGHVAHSDMIGSWAGAMGHPQFMPSSFMRYAVDLRGDGRKDIWNSVPDALASAGNYLKEHGWRAGETWGYEVRLPRDFDFAQGWGETNRTLGQWAAQGVTRANGRPFPRPDDVGTLHVPMGGNGPVFLLLPNFNVIKRYNNSSSYALAVGHLADRILGAGGFAASWPADTGLSREQRMQVQSLLSRKGYDVGPVDGVTGPKTRNAVRAWQARNGHLPDGHVGGRLLSALQG